MTHRNIRAGRVDLDGATRLGLIAAAGVAFARFISTDRLGFRYQLDAIDVLAWGSFLGMGVWSAYAAVEPIVRRRRPRMLISWTRLVDGRVGDPLVGRGILLGMLAAVVMASALRYGHLAGIAGRIDAPIWYGFSLPSTSQLLVGVIVSVVVSCMLSFLALVILIGIFRVVRREKLAILLWIPGIALLNDHTWAYPWSWAIMLVLAAMLAAIYLRAGILAATTTMIVSELLLGMPVRADLTDWTGSDSRTLLIVLACVLAWAWWASSFGRVDRRDSVSARR